MAFVRFRVQQIAWTTSPDSFASSNMVERGFCKVCGTPLTYRHVAGPFISMTVNSLDNPEVPPELCFETGQMAPWLRSLDSLPSEAADVAATPGFINYQRP